MSNTIFTDVQYDKAFEWFTYAYDILVKRYMVLMWRYAVTYSLTNEEYMSLMVSNYETDTLFELSKIEEWSR